MFSLKREKMSYYKRFPICYIKFTGKLFSHKLLKTHIAPPTKFCDKS